MVRKILVIDDDAAIRGMYQVMLMDLGVELLEAHGGESGLNLARIHRPEVVILDLQMPGMDGFETFQGLGEIPGMDLDRVILCSGINEVTGAGFTVNDLRFRLARRPAVFLEKPVAYNAMRAAVLAILERSAPGPAPDARS